MTPPPSRTFVPYNQAEPRHRALIDEATTIYCRWLNQYIEDDPHTHGDFRYGPAHFLDPTTNKYANVSFATIKDEENYVFNESYFELSMDDGDDGGPSKLYVYADRDNETYTIKFILQEFDTMFSPVYNGDPEHLFKNE